MGSTSFPSQLSMHQQTSPLAALAALAADTTGGRIVPPRKRRDSGPQMGDYPQAASIPALAAGPHDSPGAAMQPQPDLTAAQSGPLALASLGRRKRPMSY